MEEQANHIVKQLDTATLQFLDHWDYGQRGQANFWSRRSGDSLIFNCSFLKAIDTPKINVYQVERFLNYFKSSVTVDTIYWQIQFTKIGDTSLKLIGIDNHGQDILISKDLSLSKVFPEQNPFDLFAKLTDLKDQINVIGISHFNDLGSFVQFYLPSGQHILTYIPDTLVNSPNFTKFWKIEFSKGKQIKSGWNFRKLENPLDSG